MNLRLSATALAFAAWILMGSPPPTHAQDGKETSLEGQVKLGTHKLKLDDQSLYQLEVKGKAFMPSVIMLGQNLVNTADFSKERNTWRGIFAPPKNAEFTLTIMPTLLAPEGLLDYTLKWKALKLAETPVLQKEDKLTEDDPKYANPKYALYKGPYKEYPIKLKAGGIYVFEMTATKAEGNKLLPFVFLEAPSKFIVAQDLSNPKARTVFRPTADGEYRVVAATSYLTSLGAFTLTVRTVQDEK